MMYNLNIIKLEFNGYLQKSPLDFQIYPKKVQHQVSQPVTCV